MFLAIIGVVLFCQLATADLVRGRLAIEYIDFIDKNHVKVSFYLQYNNNSQHRMKLIPQFGFGMFGGLRSGDYVLVAGESHQLADTQQFLVHQIRKGAIFHHF
jgi:hypothetical protein